jgi:opacity protein-like surface antigen
VRTNSLGKSFWNNNFRVKLCIIFLGFFSMVSTATESFAQTIEVTPFVGYSFGGSLQDSVTGTKLDIKDSESYGGILAYRTSRETTIELLYSHQSTELRAKGPVSTTSLTDLDMDYIHFGGSYVWYPKRKLRPFIQASLGATLLNPQRADLDSETRFSFGIGGGAKYFFTKNIGLRLDGRALGTLIDNDSAIFCSGGCTIRVSGSTLWQFEGTLGLIFAF